MGKNAERLEALGSRGTVACAQLIAKSAVIFSFHGGFVFSADGGFLFAAI